VLNRTQQSRARFWQFADGLLCALAIVLAYGLRATFPFVDLPELEGFSDYVWLLLLAGITGPVILTQQGFYQPACPTGRGTTIFIIMQSCAYAVLAMVIFLFIARVQFARSVIILGGAFAALLIYARHELTRSLASTALVEAETRRRTLWAGTPAALTRLQQGLTPAEREFLLTTAEIDPRDPATAVRLRALLHEHSVNVVTLCLQGLDDDQVRAVLTACDEEGVEVVIHPGLVLASPFRLTVDQLGGETVLYYHAQGARSNDLLLKQAGDYVGAAVLSVLLSPLFLLSALAVKLSSRGPLLYRQQRAGLNGRPFTLYKFRSMTVDADALKPGLSAQNEMSGPVFKIAADPRVTRIGRLLRRHSLDELPQLWNVLRGEMSLVGPRPLPVEEVHRFTDHTHRRRLSVKPGLTCLWQIRGRNDIASFEDWVRLDLEYIDQWSLWLDFKILLATIPVALFGRGGR
jgi:exopolysaccharide biosynthesis polyprenyl glycosylphosphotransferase